MKINGKFLLVILIFLGISGICLFSREELYVKNVIDGDTIVLSDNRTVRLIGVDCPEKAHPLKPVQYFAEEATKFVRNICIKKKVRLEFDWQKEDKHGRTLAYVFLEDGTFLNAEIIKQGYGFAYTKYPFKYLEQFRKYEKEAREKGKGLWAENGIPEIKWIESQNVKPFLIYEMANDLWGIRYNGYVKARVNNKELIETLLNLRVWVNELSPKDLEKVLLKDGWVKDKN